MDLRAAAAAVLFTAAAVSFQGPKTQVPPATSTITYLEHVEPILRAKCIRCHFEGGNAPFSLTSYRQAVRHAPTITHMAVLGLMPPWKASNTFSDLVDACTLSPGEVELLARWGATKCQLGSPDSKIPRPTPPTPAWSLKLPASQPFIVPAEGRDIEVNFILRPPANQAVAISDIGIANTNPKIVRQVAVYLDQNGHGLHSIGKASNYAFLGGPGFPPSAFLGSFAPNFAVPPLPDGVFATIRPEDRLVVHIRYRPSGKTESDRPTLLLRTAPLTSAKSLAFFSVNASDLAIPPNLHGAILHYTAELPEAMTVISLLPQMRWLGKSIKATALTPAGASIPLVYIPLWDYQWQMSYQLVHPVTLPKGTRIRLDLVYDNAADNPANPFSPPRTIHYSEGPKGEVGRLLIGYVAP